MPRLSIWSIRISLIYLVAGWSVGALLMLSRAWGFAPGLWGLLELHVALVLYGWFLQVVIGVAYWMLPTFGGRENRGRVGAAWTSVIAVNAGVAWVGLKAVAPLSAPPVEVVCWLVAVVSFGWHAWPRIKKFGED